MPYQPADAGDIITLDNKKAGALTLSSSLANYDAVSTSPTKMFARRDAFRTVAESIAFAMAGVPLDLYRRDDQNGREKLGEGEHPVATALDAPSAGMTQYRLRAGIHLDRIMWDRWAVLMLDTEAGLELVRLPGKWISFAVDGLRRITDVVLRNPSSSAKKLYIPIDRVIFDVGYDPTPSGDETSGFPISRTLEASAMELERGAAFREALLAGGPKVPMYVKRPKDAPKWDKGGREAFEASFKSFSADRAGQVPLLEDGMELAAAPQVDKDSVQYKETRLAAQIEFAIAMHFPPELVGYRAGNFSNIAALREYLYVDVLGNEFTAERQAWNAGLARAGRIQRGVEYIEENVAVRLRGNPELQASILQTQVGAPVRTVNEARGLLNLPPIDGGDELIVPLNVVRGGLASPTDTGPKTLALSEPSLRGRGRQLDLGDGKARTPKAYLNRIEAQRARFAADLERTFQSQARRITKGLGDGSSPGALDAAYDVVLESDELQRVIIQHSYAIAVTGAAIVLDRFNPDREGFSEEKMLPWLTKAAAGDALRIATSTFRSLADKIAGEDWSAGVASVLSELVGSGPELWSTSIATTSSSFGSNDAARASGLGLKTWIHTGGVKSRPEHAAMNGETVPIDELFSNGLRWPGDPAGGPEENAQCHCRIEYSRGEP